MKLKGANIVITLCSLGSMVLSLVTSHLNSKQQKELIREESANAATEAVKALMNKEQ